MTSREPLRLVAATTVAPVSVRGLSKRFGALTAVDDLSFDASARAVTGFLGGNGAGKTTTLRMILGLVHPSAGTAAIAGRPYRELEDPARTVGAHLDSQSFHPGVTGRAHLRVLAAAYGVPDRRVDEVLDEVRLSTAADRRAGTYSLGMRQRLGLAGALLGQPRVLVLDEPATGLDPQGIRWLRGLLRAFAADGNAVLVSSHLLAEVEVMADDVVVIQRGRLLHHGPVRQLMEHVTALVVETGQADRLARVLESAGLEVVRTGAEQLTVRGAEAGRVGELAVRAGVPVSGLRQERARLEQLFFEITEEDG